MNNKIIERATIVIRNFAGKPDEFHKQGGYRYFHILLSDDIHGDVIEELLDEGWNLKHLDKRNPEDPERYRLEVAVRFDNYPPIVYMCTNHRKTLLDETNIASLDRADILNANLVINGSRWEKNYGAGIKAYLKTGYIDIEPDPFYEKYADYEEC